MRKAYLLPHPPLIVPGIGDGTEIPDTRHAYEQVATEVNDAQPDTVVIISPHSIMYGDYIHISPGKKASGDFGSFRAKHIRFDVAYDTELARLIGILAQGQGISAGSMGDKQPALDHGVMVPLHFLHSQQIVRISLSGLSLVDHYRLGMCIHEAARQLSRKIVLIASGDMSHKLKADGPYGFVPEGPEHDAYVQDCLRDGDFRKLLAIDPVLCERAAECGLRSIVMLGGFMDGARIQSRVLSYEGPFGVGYLVAAFTGDGETPSLLPTLLADIEAKRESRRQSEDAYVRLARRNVEQYVSARTSGRAVREDMDVEQRSRTWTSGHSIPLPADLPTEMLNTRAGVFVSIKKDGQLRGCIGTIAPTQENIALEILENSISASTKDPRFDPITPDELDSLTYSVDVLSPAEPITGPEMLDVRRYGVIVTHGYRRGLLLPNLDGVDTVDQQISIALQKAGIRAHEPYSMERFEVVRHY